MKLSSTHINIYKPIYANIIYLLISQLHSTYRSFKESCHSGRCALMPGVGAGKLSRTGTSGFSVSSGLPDRVETSQKKTWDFVHPGIDFVSFLVLQLGFMACLGKVGCGFNVCAFYKWCNSDAWESWIGLGPTSKRTMFSHWGPMLT